MCKFCHLHKPDQKRNAFNRIQLLIASAFSIGATAVIFASAIGVSTSFSTGLRGSTFARGTTLAGIFARTSGVSTSLLNGFTLGTTFTGVSTRAAVFASTS
eukprot:TRINITY_DN422_c0_g1_i2.p2 TRINITY_DN422_c0_g1~~TRINITY_DN422_c0_g1_i2.p2  ORF type:complete len:101 (+),score=11.93 TRINITY_DN422_c0_g1_i2:2-304(+)